MSMDGLSMSSSFGSDQSSRGIWDLKSSFSAFPKKEFILVLVTLFSSSVLFAYDHDQYKLIYDNPKRMYVFNGWRTNHKDAKIDLSKSFFSKSQLWDVDLSNANLIKADFSLSNIARGNLSNANLTGANLGGASLEKANLTYAILTAARLYKANLTNANLTSANLKEAKISGANFTGADLTGAKLYDVDYSNVDFSGAKIDSKWKRFIIKNGKAKNVDKIIWNDNYNDMDL